jgi:diguanylate cyclase (GGDEF)-like protein
VRRPEQLDGRNLVLRDRVPHQNLAAPVSPEPRDILNSINAVVYDWDIGADSLSWGANVAEVLRAFTPRSLATGAGFTKLLTPNSETSRFLTIRNSDTPDDGFGVPYRAVYGMKRPGRDPVAVEDLGRWFAGADGRPARAHGVLRVIAADERDSGASAVLARRDPLTGVFNRSHLIGVINAHCAHLGHAPTPFSVLVLSIEHLVDINQVDGYDVADEIIAQSARLIANSIRAADVLARYAGGKFAVVLAGCDQAQAAVAARRILRMIAAEPIKTSARDMRVSARIGAALGPRHGRNANVLLERAEEACDFACHSATERYVLYSPGFAHDEARVRATSQADEIINALNQRRVVLAYQPIVPASVGGKTFCEALLRVRRDDGSLINPSDLLPVAEKLGLIIHLDQRVLELALDRMSREPNLRVSINVSAATLRDPEWIDRFTQTLAVNPGAAERLIVEVIETIAIADVEATIRLLARMKRLGVKVAMDDFGSGHTSFKNLRSLGVDIVKIDGAFVQNIARSADDRFFVRTLIDLARHLGIETVAEWVEDAEAMRLLTSWGVDYMQGHFFGQAEIPANSPAVEIAPAKTAQAAL